ncbi:MAG: hypothetical protein IJW46_02710 [Clostridia bacterium]|nr:hypothetical protein [Clostridia bacterium]
MNLYWECIGYLGTALVIVSMTMTSLTRLRLINIAGSAISAVYAIKAATYPVALLNLVLIGIHLFKLIRGFCREKTYTLFPIESGALLRHLLTAFGLTHSQADGKETYLLYQKNEACGIWIGKKKDTLFDAETVRLLPKHRTKALYAAFLDGIPQYGITALSLPITHTKGIKHLAALGFHEENGHLVATVSSKIKN